MLEKARSRKARTVGIALLVTSLAARPKTMAELDALMVEQGIPSDRRPTIRRAWASGAAIFYVADLMLFASRSETFPQEFMMGQFEGALPSVVEDMRASAQRLIDGSITIDEFQRQITALIETSHWEAGIALFGPALWLFPAVLLLVRQLIDRQLAWLRGLVLDIRLGRQRLDGSLLRRIAMYARAAWSALVEFSRHLARLRGFTEELNVLGVAEHCQGCIDEAARGWVPIGTLVPIGQRQCLSNCACRYIFR